MRNSGSRELNHIEILVYMRKFAPDTVIRVHWKSVMSCCHVVQLHWTVLTDSKQPTRYLIPAEVKPQVAGLAEVLTQQKAKLAVYSTHPEKATVACQDDWKAMSNCALKAATRAEAEPFALCN